MCLLTWPPWDYKHCLGKYSDGLCGKILHQHPLNKLCAQRFCMYSVFNFTESLGGNFSYSDFQDEVTEA